MAPTFTKSEIPQKKRAGKNEKANGAQPKLETKLWAAADKLRGHMDAAEYKHVVLGLIFLKYISDAFEEHQNKLKEEMANPERASFIWTSRRNAKQRLKTATNTSPQTSSGCRRKRAGRTCAPTPSSPQ
jgi:type I restriction-modification system DNA methylase subunit